MAEEGEEIPDTGNGSWWGSFIKTAKNKSVEVLDFMKKDFDELSSAVQTEASTLANEAANVVRQTLQLEDENSTANTMKKSVSNFFGSVKEALSPTACQDFDEALLIKDGTPVTLSRLQTKIYSLCNDDKTFLDEIEPSQVNQFEAWLSVSEEHVKSVDRLTALLSSNQLLQEKYSSLVPLKVDHSKFWERFLFRKALLEDKEAEFQRKMEKEKIQAETYPWHQETKLVDGVFLSEEQQIKILTAYDEEQKRKSACFPNEVPSSNGKEVLPLKEKNGLVIVGHESSQASTSSKASTDEDWEKEFDLDEVESEDKSQKK